jgi:hypothetical protein
VWLCSRVVVWVRWRSGRVWSSCGGWGFHDGLSDVVGDGEGSVGVQDELPSEGVDEVVVPRTCGQHVVEIGRTAVFPGDDVMDSSVIVRCAGALGQRVTVRSCVQP